MLTTPITLLQIIPTNELENVLLMVVTFGQNKCFGNLYQCLLLFAPGIRIMSNANTLSMVVDNM